MKRKRTTAMIFYFSAAMAWAKALSRSAFQSSNLQRRSKFTITAPYPPTADQPQAIQSLVERFERGDKFAVLRGCTGTGKTMVMAHTIANLGRPTLVLCHNKTLAAQIARELRSFLRKNRVHLFVSHFDHYVPESYSVTTGKYVSKKSSVNDELDALRHMATRALVQHEDVVVVASVSCIYGLGMPKSYLDKSFTWRSDGSTQFELLQDAIKALENNLYVNAVEQDDDAQSHSGDLHRGQYELTTTSTSASISLWPPYELYPMRVDFVHLSEHESGDGNWKVQKIATGNNSGLEPVDSITIFPAKHHVTDSEEAFQEALRRIEDECVEQSKKLRKSGKNAEAERLQQWVANDLLLLKESGSCPGVENYSRHLHLREEGASPDTLLDYFGLRNDGWMCIIDESHVALPQLKAMYAGDRARKLKLVEHGYRLPSALDNRPLKSDEFWERVERTLFVSATPGPMELELVDNCVDMSIRPTYVPDPVINVRPTKGQLDDLVKEVQSRALKGERTLALTLTKKDAEDLSQYLTKEGIKTDFIHSGLKTHERSKVLNALQEGSIDCLVGVNVLREGLDLPQVSLVAILGADVEGFLRSETALLQMVGRAARNINGQAIFYADATTNSMQKCIEATASRRAIQIQYNEKHGKEMRSTTGSSMLSIFEILKDDIQVEQALDIYSHKNNYDDQETIKEPVTVSIERSSHGHIQTDHVPSKPGVYFWKDSSANILYIGKAKRLRSRVKSYLTPSAKHTERIKIMLKKAHRVEFILTPTERDALVLESSLIKLHQPPYNVLLKDDDSFPFVCASLGDQLPSFSLVPRPVETPRSSSGNKYWGPYPNYNDAAAILRGIEEEYGLRSKSFQCRFGDLEKDEYLKSFNQALDEVFCNPSGKGSRLPTMRLESESSLLFDHRHNAERDVISVAKYGDRGEALVHVVQLRDGVVMGQYSYSCSIATGIAGDDDLGGIIQTVLEQKHYPLGDISQSTSNRFFPRELLVQHPLADASELRKLFRRQYSYAEPMPSTQKLTIRTPAAKGARAETDKVAMTFALENAHEVVRQRSLQSMECVHSSLDGSAANGLAELLSLTSAPHRIEAYDISHTKGHVAVGSRVVFEGGKPLKKDYRRFNIRSVEGIDDYASIEEVVSRRFRKVWIDCEGGLVGDDDPWKMPDLVVIDGGLGQLSAAIQGMKKAGVFPSNKKNDQEETNNARSATVPVISLAKNLEEVFAPDSSKPLNDSPDSPALILLRSLRDESHRFALSNHRRRRSKLAGLK